MSSPLYLALLGFPSNEIAAFNALFRLAARNGPGFAMVERPDRANVIIANADDTALVQKLHDQRLAARVLLIGASDCRTGWPVLARPIQLLQVLDTVQRLGRTYPTGLQAGAGASRAPHADDAVTGYAGLDTGTQPNTNANPAPRRRDATVASAADMATAFDTAPPSFQTTQAPADAADEAAAPAFAATVPFSHTLAPATSPAPLSRAHDASPAFAATVPYTAADVAPRPSAYAPTAPAALRPEPAATEFAATVPFNVNEPFAATEPFVPDAAVLAARALPVGRTGDVIDRASIALWREARRVHVPSQSPVAFAATGSGVDGRRPAPAAPRGISGADRNPVRIEPRLDTVAGDPAASAAAAGRARPWAAPEADAGAPPPAQDNLLVVDADDRSRRSLLNLLGQQGWRVDMARSHDEARRQLARRSYRLVVVGESVQGANVFKTCRALRRHPGLNGANLRIVLVLDRRRGWLARWRARWAGYDLCVFGAFDPAALGGMLGAAVRAEAATV